MSRIEEALARAAEMQPAEGRSDGGWESRPESAPLAYTQSLETLEVPEQMLVTVTSPYSPVAEEFRKLKEALVKLTNREHFDNLIMFTSATAGEGKSMSAINLAVSLAQEYDHTVLLVDADLRRPSCHRYLGLEAGPGLSDCLLDGVNLADVLVKTGIGKLSLLPAGKLVSNPGELFSSNAMKRLLRELKSRYSDRYVIVDTPPVLPFAETRTVSNLVDGIILVVKEGQPSLDEVKECVEALGKKVLGILYNFTMVQPQKSYYYYYK